MATNKELITSFYTAFGQLDHTAMNACYSDEIIFFDPVFEMLKGDQVRAMWAMLCSNAKSFSLTFENVVELDEEYATVEWTASYVFSKTGRPVVNHVKANMRFSGGKIIEHSDAFSLHRWSAQALGWSGWLLGWNTFFQRRIKNKARRSLWKFMGTKQEQMD